MDTIRVTCPACKATLEVDADKAGTEVECGECFQVFKAKGGESKIKGAPVPKGKAAKPKPPGRRRDDDDDDEYEHDHRREEYDEEDYDPAETRGRRRASGMPSAAGTFVLGLMSFMLSCVPFISIPLAIVTLRRPPAVAYPAGSSGAVRIGKLLAQVSLGFWVFVVVALYYIIRSH